MPHQGELEGVAAPDRLMVGKFANDLVRQVFALEQAKQIALLQMGIARQPHKHLFRGFFEEAFDFRARRNRDGPFGPLPQAFMEGEVSHQGRF